MTARGGTWWALALLLAGCPGTKEKQALAVLAEGCSINTDCDTDAGLICAFRRCHEPCRKTSDCPVGSMTLCVPANPMPVKACLLPDEFHCSFNSDCAEGLICGVDGVCRFQCLSSRDCVEQQHCVLGTCADDVMLADGGFGAATLTPADGGVLTCAYNSDCPVPLACRLGACVTECRLDRDCPADETCLDGNCHVVTTNTLDAGQEGWPCTLNSDCDAPLICNPLHVCQVECREARDCDAAAGYCCYQTQCRRGPVCNQMTVDGGFVDAGTGVACINDLDCDAGWCDGFSPCVHGQCQKPLHPICDDENPCTNDHCDPDLHTCAYESAAGDAGDQDGDGHYATACGGTADDCDDTNPNTYFGHPEECDFQDNNCDGYIDEFLWHERPGSEAAVAAGGAYSWWAGVPQAVKIDGGILVVASTDTTNGSADLFFLDDTATVLHGPLRVAQSTTQWVVSATQPTLYGKRALAPQLAVGDGHALVSAWIGDQTGTIDCPNGGPWALTDEVSTVNLSATTFSRWADFASDGTRTCYQVYPEAAPELTPPQLAFNPRTQRWLAVYGSTTTYNNQSIVYANHYETDGGLGSPHPLLPTPTDAVHYGGNGLQPPWMVVGPSNVMVAWLPYNGQPHYILMDDDLNSALTTMAVINISQGYETIVGAGFAHGSYYLELGNAVSATHRVVFIDPSTGALVASASIPLTAPGTFSTIRGANTIYSDGLAEVGPGMLYAVNRFPDIEIGWFKYGRDGGYGDTVASRANVPRSGSSMVMIDEKTAALFFVDGDLKRTIIECAP